MKSERDIEIWVEKQVDRLDKRYMSDDCTMTESEYKLALKQIDLDADQMYSEIGIESNFCDCGAIHGSDEHGFNGCHCCGKQIA